MKKLVLVLLLATGVSAVYSQSDWTKAKCFAEMDKIVKKPNGQPILSGLYLKKATLVSQTFSATSITKTVREEPAKAGDQPFKMVNRYTKIPWDKLERYSFDFIVREKPKQKRPCSN